MAFWRKVIPAARAGGDGLLALPGIRAGAPDGERAARFDRDGLLALPGIRAGVGHAVGTEGWRYGILA